MDVRREGIPEEERKDEDPTGEQGRAELGEALHGRILVRYHPSADLVTTEQRTQQPEGQQGFR